MQRVTMVRYTVKRERLEENEALARKVFTELKGAAPDQLAYALFRNGAEFVHLLVNRRTDDSDALTSLSAFRTYTKDIAARCEGPIETTRLSLDLLESYGFATAGA